MQPSWTDSEPGWEVARAELSRMYRRVRARWLVVLVLTLLTTALIVVHRARKPVGHEASIVVRVMEADFDRDSAPPTSTQLQDYLWEVVLNRLTLLEIIEKNELYPSKLEIGREFAIQTMREDLDIDVIRNFFAEQRYSEDPPRTARLRIRYSGRTTQHALSAVRHIARRIAELEANNRERAAAYAAESASRTASGLQDRYLQLQREQNALRQQVEQDPSDMTAVVRLQGFHRQLQHLRQQIRAVEQEASSLRLRTELEGQEMGLRFEIVDPGKAKRPLISQQAKLVLIGAFSFLFLLPVVGVGVGAYDLRIYNAEDLRCLGAEAFGHVPAFSGFRVGAIGDRVPAAQVNRDRRQT